MGRSRSSQRSSVSIREWFRAEQSISEVFPLGYDVPVKIECGDARRGSHRRRTRPCASGAEAPSHPPSLPFARSASWCPRSDTPSRGASARPSRRSSSSRASSPCCARSSAAEGQSQQAIGERLQIPPSRMVAFVDALEARSLLERRHNPHDRRTRELHLTEAGVSCSSGRSRSPPGSSSICARSSAPPSASSCSTSCSGSAPGSACRPACTPPTPRSPRRSRRRGARVLGHGGGRIRTCEGRANAFTARPL